MVADDEALSGYLSIKTPEDWVPLWCQVSSPDGHLVAYQDGPPHPQHLAAVIDLAHATCCQALQEEAGAFSLSMAKGEESATVTFKADDEAGKQRWIEEIGRWAEAGQQQQYDQDTAAAPGEERAATGAQLQGQEGEEKEKESLGAVGLTNGDSNAESNVMTMMPAVPGEPSRHDSKAVASVGGVDVPLVDIALSNLSYGQRVRLEKELSTALQAVEADLNKPKRKPKSCLPGPCGVM